MSNLRAYGQSQIQLNDRLRTDLEKLDGRSRNPALTATEFQELLDGDVTLLRKRLKAVARLNRELRYEIGAAIVAQSNRTTTTA